MVHWEELVVSFVFFQLLFIWPELFAEACLEAVYQTIALVNGQCDSDARQGYRETDSEDVCGYVGEGHFLLSVAFRRMGELFDAVVARQHCLDEKGVEQKSLAGKLKSRLLDL